MRQVDDFAIAAPDSKTANILLDMIDNHLTIPVKRQGYLDMYNGIDVRQTRHYIKLSVRSFIDKVFEKHLATWMKSTYPNAARSTPLPSDPIFQKKFNSSTGNPDKNAQRKLSTKMQLNYRSGVGKLIWAMTTCRPNLSYSSVKLSQSNPCPHKIHYHVLSTLSNSCTSPKMMACTSGKPIPAWTYLSAPCRPSGATGRTSSLMDAHNLMQPRFMHTQTPTGQHAPRLDGHSAVPAFD
jgi:hypothetical protein